MQEFCQAEVNVGSRHFFFTVLVLLNQLLFIFAIVMRHADSKHVAHLVPSFIEKNPKLITIGVSALAFVLAFAKVVLVISFSAVQAVYPVEANNFSYDLSGEGNEKMLMFAGAEYVDWDPVCNSTALHKSGKTIQLADCKIPIDCDSLCPAHLNPGVYFLAPTYLLSALYISMLAFKCQKRICVSLEYDKRVVALDEYDGAAGVIGDSSAVVKFILTALTVASILHPQSILGCDGFSDALPNSTISDKLQSPAIVEDHCQPQNENNAHIVNTVRLNFIVIAIALTALFGVGSCARWWLMVSRRPKQVSGLLQKVAIAMFLGIEIALLSWIGAQLYLLDGHSMEFECSSVGQNQLLGHTGANHKQDSSPASGNHLVQTAFKGCQPCGFGYEPCENGHFCNNNFSGQAGLSVDWVYLPFHDCPNVDLPQQPPASCYHGQKTNVTVSVQV